MSRLFALQFPRSDDGYPGRVARALRPHPVGAVAFVTVAPSLGPIV